MLVARTPYNKDERLSGGDMFNILRAVQAGYTVVIQDVRGRLASEGIFNPHIQETDDGVDKFAEPPADELSDVYLHNPLRPVPTIGGQVILPGRNVGPRDQREVELRDDVLVYSTPLLEMLSTNPLANINQPSIASSMMRHIRLI